MKPGALVVLLLVATTAAASPAPQESLVGLLPARATAAALVRTHAIQPLMDFTFADPEMMKELRPFLERTVGLDVTRLDGVAAFAIDPLSRDPHVGVVLRIPGSSSSPLHLKIAGDAGGTPLYALTKGNVCARVKSGLAVGDAVAVRAAVAVDRGKEPALARDGALGRLLAADAVSVDMVVGVAGLPADKTMGIEDGVLTLGREGLLQLVVHGNALSLGMVRAVVTQGISAALTEVQKEKDVTLSAANADPAKGTGMLLAYYALRRMAAELTPVLDGNALKMHYQLPDLRPLASPSVLVLTLAASGAAFADSALKKYTTRSKLAGTHAEVRRIGSAIAATVGGGKKLSSLKSTDWTPKGPCCGQPDNKCAVDGKAFSASTWKAIGYQPLEPSAFHYRLRVDAKAKRVTIEAEGDLDCDGVVTTVSTDVSFEDGPGVVGEIVDSGDLE